MLIFNNLSSLFSIMSKSWIGDVFISFGLIILGWVYQFVSYCFKLFTLMCQINFNGLYSLLEPLVNRLEALVMVIIMFKLAISLITYLFNPESAPKEGAKLIKNIAITAALLISYNFIFGVMNEISMLVIGSPEGYEFTYLSDIIDTDTTGDEGLISRFIFGESDVKDAGDYVAYNVLSIFIYDMDSKSSTNRTSNILANVLETDEDGIKFSDLKNMSIYVNKTVYYTPFLGTIMGLYIVYCVVKASIQIGIRMFKLILLQILAPLAIVAIIKDGVKGGMFKKFIEMYIEIYIEAFTRMAAMLLSIVFISKFVTSIGILFKDSTFSEEQTFTTQGFLTILVVIAGIKFATEMPKLIDKLLGTHIADSKGGFGHLVGGLIGGTVGFAGGVAAGFRAGGIKGVGNALYNGVAGGINGASSASKGKNIAETFKAINENSKKTQTSAQNIARQGGLAAAAMHGTQRFFGVPQAQQAKEAREKDDAAALENMLAARRNAISNQKSAAADKRADRETTGSNKAIKYGDSAESYAQAALEYDAKYQAARNDYETHKTGKKTDDHGVTYSTYDYMIKMRDEALDAYKADYDDAMFDDTLVGSNAEVSETTRIYDKRADKGHKSDDIKSHSIGIKDAQVHYKESTAKYHNKFANQRDQRQGRYGGGSK